MVPQCAGRSAGGDRSGTVHRGEDDWPRRSWICWRIPKILERAKAEFNERTGGGVGGTKWVAPLLPRDFVPPVDLRWPEYIYHRAWR